MRRDLEEALLKKNRNLSDNEDPYRYNDVKNKMQGESTRALTSTGMTLWDEAVTTYAKDLFLRRGYKGIKGPACWETVQGDK